MICSILYHKIMPCCKIFAINDCIRIEQFKWSLVKKASQVLYLHFALKKRAFIEELYGKQEQVDLLYITHPYHFLTFLDQ